MEKRSTVEIVACQRTDRSIYLEVSVRSVLRPNHLLMGILEHDEITDNALMVLAGALAEELCVRFGDTVDPDIVAHTAVACYHEMVEENVVLQPGNELPRYADRYTGMARN